MCSGTPCLCPIPTLLLTCRQPTRSIAPKRVQTVALTDPGCVSRLLLVYSER
jgi:hypothetical protein